jgi:ESCRT-I complex subunit TSG101
LLKERICEADSYLAAASDARIDLDADISASTPLHRQICDLVAEDSAIEDTIYALLGVLRSGRVETTWYLRTVRTLSARQFTVRALLRKARAVARMS